MSLLYFTVANMSKISLLSCCRWRVRGRVNMPADEPLIIVSNHPSWADPLILTASISRQIKFMAKEELFGFPLGICIRALGAFPIRRDSPGKEALYNAIEMLENGQVIGMFPEGGRSRNGQMGKAKLGAALIASRSGATVLPIGISGSENIKKYFKSTGVFFRRPTIDITIGQPLSFPKNSARLTKRQLVTNNNIIMERIADVLPRYYQGKYRGIN